MWPNQSITYDCRSCWQISLQGILAVIPFARLGEEASGGVHALKATEFLSIAVQNHSVRPCLLYADLVVCEAPFGMEVEDKEETGSLENDDLISLVLQANISLLRVQPAVLIFCSLHCCIELIEKLVSQKTIIWKVKLAPRILVAVSVALSWEVKPLAMAELVALEVEVSLTTEGVGDEADHLVQSHATVNQWHCDLTLGYW